MIFNPILGTLRLCTRGIVGQYVCADRRRRHLVWFGRTLEHRPREAIPTKVVNVAVPELCPLILVTIVQSGELFSAEHLGALGLSFALQPHLLPLELLLLLSSTLLRASRPLCFVQLGCMRR
jgi:hypothetical protein